jgi:uncharacterized protein
MFVCALRIELFFPIAHSLKEKRAIITPVIEGLRNRYRVASAETGFQDLWQRCEIGVACVGGSVSHVEQVLDECERFVWSFPELQVSTIERLWLE